MSFNGDLYPEAGADVVMTTKGDVVRYDSQRERYGIGSTGQVMAVSSGLPAWTTLSTADSVLTTQGDILYEGAAGLARLGFGTSGDVLTTKGTGANPVWETPSGRLKQLAHADTTNATTDSVALTFSSIDLNDYSSLMLEFSGVGVGALDIELLIGAVTSGYRYGYDKSVTGTWTNVNATGQSEIKLADLGAGDWFYVIANLAAWESNEGGDGYSFNWKANAFSTDQWIGGGFADTGSNNITSVTIQTSASYFAEHCRFNLMGLNRS